MNQLQQLHQAKAYCNFVVLSKFTVEMEADGLNALSPLIGGNVRK